MYSPLSSNQDRMTTKQTNANVTIDEAHCRNPFKLFTCVWPPHAVQHDHIWNLPFETVQTNRQFKQRESVVLNIPPALYPKQRRHSAEITLSISLTIQSREHKSDYIINMIRLGEYHINARSYIKYSYFLMYRARLVPEVLQI